MPAWRQRLRSLGSQGARLGRHGLGHARRCALSLLPSQLRRARKMPHARRQHSGTPSPSCPDLASQPPAPTPTPTHPNTRPSRTHTHPQLHPAMVAEPVELPAQGTVGLVPSGHLCRQHAGHRCHVRPAGTPGPPPLPPSPGRRRRATRLCGPAWPCACVAVLPLPESRALCGDDLAWCHGWSVLAWPP